MISWSIRRHKNKLVYKIFKLLLKHILRFYSVKCRSLDALLSKSSYCRHKLLFRMNHKF